MSVTTSATKGLKSEGLNAVRGVWDHEVLMGRRSAKNFCRDGKYPDSRLRRLWPRFGGNRDRRAVFAACASSSRRQRLKGRSKCANMQTSAERLVDANSRMQTVAICLPFSQPFVHTRFIARKLAGAHFVLRQGLPGGRAALGHTKVAVSRKLDFRCSNPQG